jgi:hypothetical protein
MKANEDKPGRDARRAADWISLAAAPTFAIMALIAGIAGGGRMAAMCPPLGDQWALSGMAPMYLLMSAFHSPAWLRLMSRRRRAEQDGVMAQSV